MHMATALCKSQEMQNACYESCGQNGNCKSQEADGFASRNHTVLLTVLGNTGWYNSTQLWWHQDGVQSYLSHKEMTQAMLQEKIQEMTEQ